MTIYNIQVTAFFQFCRVKVMNQQMDTAQNTVNIEAEPDERYHPVCSSCHAKVKRIHSYHRRTVRDLNLFNARCYVTLTYRKLQPLRRERRHTGARAESDGGAGRVPVCLRSPQRCVRGSALHGELVTLRDRPKRYVTVDGLRRGTA